MLSVINNSSRLAATEKVEASRNIVAGYRWQIGEWVQALVEV